MACNPTWEWGMVMAVMEQLVLEEDHLDQLQALVMVSKQEVEKEMSTPNRPMCFTLILRHIIDLTLSFLSLSDDVFSPSCISFLHFVASRKFHQGQFDVLSEFQGLVLV